MTTSPDILRTITVTTRHDLATLWSALMGDGGFGRRTLWLVILDERGRPTPVVMPIDDIPEVPSAAEVDSFGHFFDHLDGYGTPVLLLSRPGPCAVQEHDRQWARALAPLAPRWPLHLATEDRLRSRRDHRPVGSGELTRSGLVEQPPVKLSGTRST